MRPGLSSTTCPTRRELHDSALCCILYKVCRADIGAMAQLVAHLHGMERVRGSNPLSSTEEILEQYADDYHSWRAHTGGETKHGVESRRHTGQRGAHAIEASSPNMPAIPCLTTLLAVGHGSWIVATVAVLLDMDPDDLNNLGAMRNAFWTRMSVDADPSRTRHMALGSSTPSTKARPSRRLRTGRMGRRNCAPRTCRCGSPSCSDHVTHGGPLLTVGASGEHEFSMKSPACGRLAPKVGLS